LGSPFALRDHLRGLCYLCCCVSTLTIGRRELVAALGGMAAAWPLAVRAQQPAMPVTNCLASSREAGDKANL
jgi:hypothetical protein